MRMPGENWQYRLKVTEESVKTSNPGILQVRRYFDDAGAAADAIYDIGVDLAKGCEIVSPDDEEWRRRMGKDARFQDLLVPVFRGGKLVCERPGLEEIWASVRTNLNQFEGGIKRIAKPAPYAVGLERGLHELKKELIGRIR